MSPAGNSQNNIQGNDCHNKHNIDPLNEHDTGHNKASTPIPPSSSLNMASLNVTSLNVPSLNVLSSNQRLDTQPLHKQANKFKQRNTAKPKAKILKPPLLNHTNNHQSDKSVEIMSNISSSPTSNLPANPVSHGSAQSRQMTTQISGTGVVHPNFDPTQQPLNPDRPLTDLPMPAPRYEDGLRSLFDSTREGLADYEIAVQDLTGVLGLSDTKPTVTEFGQASPWALIASPELASHLELLQLGGLIQLPKRFFETVSSPKSELGDEQAQLCYEQELLTPLTQLKLLDLSDINQVCADYPNLSRYGFNYERKQGPKRTVNTAKPTSNSQNSETDLADMPEMINDAFAPSWELILYPERFDNGVDSLSTDILACSVAVHALQQCQTRKTVNRSVSMQQICQHMRSYVLSQCNLHPQFEQQYRQIRLFAGHVIVAAVHLGLKISSIGDSANCADKQTQSIKQAGQDVYINVSSRTPLLTRYPNLSDYYINGWS